MVDWTLPIPLVHPPPDRKVSDRILISQGSILTRLIRRSSRISTPGQGKAAGFLRAPQDAGMMTWMQPHLLIFGYAWQSLLIGERSTCLPGRDVHALPHLT